MNNKPRLIERAFPLKQASIDSVHEKNVRHGHISTLHIWPARRPLAACRAALIATLLPDPDTPEERQRLCEKIGGKVVQVVKKKELPSGKVEEKVVEETVGGVLHWGRESDPAMDWFCEEIRKAYGGRPPKVLDPFAGGGSIPLEAMRLGCEVTASDINPVAWFILKCTLEYPQKQAGQKRPLPDFILEDEEFMEGFYKAHPGMIGRGRHSKKQIAMLFDHLQKGDLDPPEADLSWHVRTWGRWVLQQARKDLGRFYPTYADFQPLDPSVEEWERRPTCLPRHETSQRKQVRLVPTKEDGTLDLGKLNAEFDVEYLKDKRNPRWVPKPTVAYLWTRTVTCKNCRATVPLLKTRWLCKKPNKRVLLTMIVEATSRRLNHVEAVSHRLNHVEAVSHRLQQSQSGERSDETSLPQTSSTSGQTSGETPLLHYFDPSEPVANMSGNLPHWRQQGVTYFVTFRLADSLPHEKLHQWLREREEWLKKHPEPHDQKTRREYYRLFPGRFQKWLDAGYGECILAKPEIKQLVEDALRHFDGDRYVLDEFIVMPNHVHVILAPLDEHELSQILHSWKSYTAHQINKLLRRKGSVWQKESFDHIIRTPRQHERIRQYIRENPKRRSDVPSLEYRNDVPSLERRSDVPSLEYRSDVSSLDNKQPEAASTIVFGIQTDVPKKGGNAAQRREHDKRIGAGTMSRSGATCPCCGTIMTMEDIRLEGQASRLGALMTAVVVDGPKGKEYRLPTEEELSAARAAEKELDRVFEQIPFGPPDEPLPSKEALGIRVPRYGFSRWRDLFTPRQLLALGTFAKWTRAARHQLAKQGYPPSWVEAIVSYLSIQNDKVADYNSMACVWHFWGEKIGHTFTRFALPITWDFTELALTNDVGGAYMAQLDGVARYIAHALNAARGVATPRVENRSAIEVAPGNYDVIITDPPYYDAIPYSDLMDFFYVWLRRTLDGLPGELGKVFSRGLSPKWDHERNDGELIDDDSRHQGDKVKSKSAYEDRMFRAFRACYSALKPGGVLVVVFANKQSDAWETLVSALIRAGFVVDASWPIQTEMSTRMRAKASAALASSVWLVCKKRPGAANVEATSRRLTSTEPSSETRDTKTSGETRDIKTSGETRDTKASGETPLLRARPGWDNRVLEKMRENIASRLREYWDAGIRGPDFVWAATGPALEAYSKHPIVEKPNEPGQLMTVSEFLQHVRRIVVDFVIGRVLSRSDVSSLDSKRRDGASTASTVSSGADAASTSTLIGLDDVTTYYLLHRHDFGMDDAPIGPCTLYAVSCRLSDSALADQYDILVRTGGRFQNVETVEAASGRLEEQGRLEEEPVEIEDLPAATLAAQGGGTGSMVRLKPWHQRRRPNMGYDPAFTSKSDGTSLPPPLIDQVHRLMHLWKAGDIVKVDDYLELRALRRNALFHQLLQSLIELAPAGSDERSILESISNHVATRGIARDKEEKLLFAMESTD